MATFEYGQDGSLPVGLADLYRLFNNYRVWKYMIGMMIMLGKTELSTYKILEAGCAGGEKLRFFSELRTRPENCYGFDISEKAIDICKRMSPQSMNFQVASILEIPFENSMFDIVLCSNVFDCFSSDADLLKISDELWRVIKFNGALFVLDINKHFETVFATNEHVKAKGLRVFDTRNNELENLLYLRFSAFRRQDVFASEIYAEPNGQLSDIDKLPEIDLRLDTGVIPCAYTLYSFTPKP